MSTNDQSALDRLLRAREPKIKMPSPTPAKVNEKRAVVNRAYEKVKKVYMQAHPHCEANLEGCMKEATDIHHQAGKSSEELLINPDYFLAVCRKCHTWIGDNSAEALAMGLSVPRLHK